MPEPDIDDLKDRIALARQAYADAVARGDVPARDLALSRLGLLVEHAVESLAPRAADPLRMVL